MPSSLEEAIVAGGAEGEFCTLRHLVVRGSQEMIGAKLAAVAARNHAIVPQPAIDPVVTRARRRWREQFYPQLAARVRGVAGHFGVNPDDDMIDSSTLGFGFATPGCSVAWVPPRRGAGHAGLLSRNFDFTTQTMIEVLGGQPAPDEPAMAAQPYVIETYPDEGHATLVMCLFDLASGGFDGINDAGLVVALLADDQSDGPQPTFTPQVGLGEHEICRFLLETCATVDEAVEALRMVKQYYVFVPCHYLVADRTGLAFVWEHDGAAYNGEHVIWSADTQVVTNHLLWRYPSTADLPPRSRQRVDVRPSSPPHRRARPARRPGRRRTQTAPLVRPHPRHQRPGPHAVAQRLQHNELLHGDQPAPEQHCIRRSPNPLPSLRTERCCGVTRSGSCAGRPPRSGTVTPQLPRRDRGSASGAADRAPLRPQARTQALNQLHALVLTAPRRSEASYGPCPTVSGWPPAPASALGSPTTWSRSPNSPYASSPPESATWTPRSPASSPAATGSSPPPRPPCRTGADRIQQVGGSEPSGAPGRRVSRL